MSNTQEVERFQAIHSRLGFGQRDQVEGRNCLFVFWIVDNELHESGGQPLLVDHDCHSALSELTFLTSSMPMKFDLFLS
jgi:hypothetical protein